MVSIHSLADGFYRPTAEAIGFPYPNGAPPQNRTVVAALPKRCTRHCASGAWRKMVASNHWPCGHYGLANRSGSQPQHPPNGGRPMCRSPHLTVPSRFERAPGAVPVDLPYWRRAGALEAHTLSGAIGFQNRAVALDGSLSVADGLGIKPNARSEAPAAFQAALGSSELCHPQIGTPGQIRTDTALFLRQVTPSVGLREQTWCERSDSNRYYSGFKPDAPAIGLRSRGRPCGY